jgi:hypothetical protein
MPTFTVHEPSPKKKESVAAPERFVFVRDGFHFWAFLLAPLWLLAHRLWLSFFGYLILSGALAFALTYANAPSSVKFVASLMVALLVGFEAPSLWRWKLSRRKWKMLGFVVADNAEMAERRFYAEWTHKRPTRDDAPEFMAPAPVYNTPVRRGPPSGSDVIGLFPEPGNSSAGSQR